MKADFGILFAALAVLGSGVVAAPINVSDMAANRGGNPALQRRYPMPLLKRQEEVSASAAAASSTASTEAAEPASTDAATEAATSTATTEAAEPISTDDSADDDFGDDDFEDEEWSGIKGVLPPTRRPAKPDSPLRGGLMGLLGSDSEPAGPPPLAANMGLLGCLEGIRNSGSGLGKPDRKGPGGLGGRLGSYRGPGGPLGGGGRGGRRPALGSGGLQGALTPEDDADPSSSESSALPLPPPPKRLSHPTRLNKFSSRKLFLPPSFAICR
jgi:hypothetical protein